MAPARRLDDGRTARWVFSDRADGDLSIDSPAVDERRGRLVPGTWSSLRQVHGGDVLVVSTPGEHGGEEGDALVTAEPGAPIAVQTADCGAVVLVSPDGVVGVAHAGWRGLRAGVVGATVAAMRDRGASAVEAHLGPMIHPECYEFGPEDLRSVIAALGEKVGATTRDGAPALDLPSAVAVELERAGVAVASASPGCTACHGDRWYSHRARRETERMAAVVWIDA